MEKGIKTLQTTARTAQRKASADQSQAFCEDRSIGISDHNSDSGIVLCSGSEPDVEVDESENAPSSRHGHGASASWSGSYSRQQERLHQEHMRSRSLPLPLPQYQPPAPRATRNFGRDKTGPTPSTNLGAISYDRPSYTSQRYSPETQQRLSIQSVLIPEEPEESPHHETTHHEYGRQSSRLR